MKKFKKVIERDFPFLRGSRVLVAVSGGVDSLFLLRQLADLRKGMKISVGAIHINHNLRPESSDEALFVQKCCDELKIPLSVREIPKSFWAERSNMEERARSERYRFFKDSAAEGDYRYIATAHHMDDQVETILMRLFDRGSGVRGLKGIETFRKEGEITYIRPLLLFSKREIEEIMLEKPHVFDSSNMDTDIRRNHYRLNIIPQLEKLLPSGFKEKLVRLSRNISREEEFSSSMALRFWKSFKKEDGSYLIPRNEIEMEGEAFWTSALSHLFSIEKGFSHSTETLVDFARFLNKRDPAKANYSPFNVERDRNSVRLKREE